MMIPSETDNPQKRYRPSNSNKNVDCINGVSSNPVEGRTKIRQLKDLIITLFALIFRRLYIYIYI
jgi:hypothetical protein